MARQHRVEDRRIEGCLLEAIHAAGRALAIESRLPEPRSGAEALQPPLSFAWRGGLGVLRDFKIRPASPWEPAAAEIERPGGRRVVRRDGCPTWDTRSLGE